MSKYDDAKIAERARAIIIKNVENRWEVRGDIVESLLLWQDFGITPGDFLQSVLANDLAQACHNADRYNRSRIADIFCCIYNYFPRGCHGSWEQMKLWQASKQEAQS